jgi:hypothetical protein
MGVDGTIRSGRHDTQRTAAVVAWDFDVTDDGPIVVLALIPLALASVARALGRQGPS